MSEKDRVVAQKHPESIQKNSLREDAVFRPPYNTGYSLVAGDRQYGDDFPVRRYVVKPVRESKSPAALSFCLNSRYCRVRFIAILSRVVEAPQIGWMWMWRQIEESRSPRSLVHGSTGALHQSS
jgi:hypothetical protein